MAKRKLTDQQTRRVNTKRQKKTSDNGGTDNPVVTPGKSADASLLGAEQPGLVITNFGKRVLVEAESGEHFKCAIRQHLGKLVAGDQIIWQTDVEAGTGVVISVLPRTHELSRPGFRGQTRMIAANIDFIGIVMPVLPGIHPDMIDRYLVGAAQLNIPVILIINKVDLLEDEEDWDTIAALLEPYTQLGIEILPASTISQAGLHELQSYMNGKNSVFVGPSGAGKSSLINALIPDLDIRVGTLSEATGLGKHTTTNSILYHLPSMDESQKDGGNLIDSPGIRQFSPTACSVNELASYYPDFAPFLGHCKYNNCTHSIEPKCAIKDAVESGEIAYSRYLSFQRMLEEFKSEPEH
jgi:ribosome biogenesis GTPase